MVDVELAKKRFLKYTEKFDLKNENIERKQQHSLRVMQISKEIAKKMKLEKEKIKLAALIGLLHDIARFEQYTIYGTFRDFDSIDHGDYGVQILEKDIRKYINVDEYDEIIKKSVKNHNKYKIEEGLDIEEELFAKIVRDADKIDIIYEAVDTFWKKEKDVLEIEHGKLSEKMLEDFYSYMVSNSLNSASRADQILRFASFIFDINFKCSFEMLKENDNISKMIDRFNYQIPETREEMQKIKQFANDYIKEKTK